MMLTDNIFIALIPKFKLGNWRKILITHKNLIKS